MSKLLTSAISVLCLFSLAFGQATMTQTTLSAAVGKSDQYVNVSSATGITAGSTLIYVDKEAMRVRSLSGTRVRVFRAQDGTRQDAHASGAVVYVGPFNYYSHSDPTAGSPCTSAAELVLPRVVVPTGNVWQCTNSLWVLITAGAAAASGSGAPVLTTSPTITTPKVVTSINDANGNEVMKTPATASAVNEITVTNAATGDAPQVSATGGDTNVSLKLAGKGTGGIINSSGLFWSKVSVATVDTATAVTLTAAQLLGGLILEDPNGGAVTATLPTAALLVAAMPDAIVGSAFEFTIRNTADAAETITVAAGDGGTASGTMTIGQNNTKRFLVVLTNVTPSSEAYTVYSLGTVVH